jgi:chromosomal replication initiation ATPase DnaA
MNIEAQRQHREYQAVRERLWPVVPREPKISTPEEIVDRGKRMLDAELKITRARILQQKYIREREARQEAERLARQAQREADRARATKFRAKKAAEQELKRLVIVAPTAIPGATPHQYLRHRCQQLGLAMDEVLSNDRRRWLAKVRQILIWELSCLYKLSMPRLGRMFGRDHTTILYSIRKIEAELSFISCPRSA